MCPWWIDANKFALALSLTGIGPVKQRNKKHWPYGVNAFAIQLRLLFTGPLIFG